MDLSPLHLKEGFFIAAIFFKKNKDVKGKILSLYLDWLDWIPGQVVLIDDGNRNLESVQNALDRRGVPFLGFLYIPKKLDPIDEKIAELQYEMIINHRQWLSDKEAKSRISSNQD